MLRCHFTGQYSPFVIFIFEAHFRTRPQSSILYYLFISFVILILPVKGLPCSYKTPNVDELVFDVPIDIDGESLIQESDGRIRRVRDVKQTYRPLRIHLHYDIESISKLAEDVQVFVNSSLLPDAVGYWEKVLSVHPTIAPIRLNRRCLNNQYFISPDDKLQTCYSGCKEETKCGEVVVPDEHLFQCKHCYPQGIQHCIFSGPADGPGVPNSDFLLYVSAVSSQRCKNADTMAYAAHCQQESHLDRPIAGHVNLCPNSLSTQPHDQEVLVSTVKHEILHALGFSTGLYAFYRDESGRPRTKRNQNNKPISLNRERGYYDWDENTIKRIIRDDWWTADGVVLHEVHVVVTPRVQQEAREHFGCNDLEGAELENQGGDGTVFTHWEKRLFENEAMTGTHTQNPVYSRLTFALLEDSGWYMADYSMAEKLHWGEGLGCDFVKKSCGEWMKKRRERNLSVAPFCDEKKSDGKRSLATTRCTAQRDSLALCNLIPYRGPVPPEYRNFDELPGLSKEEVRNYGGSVTIADYCPYNQEFEWHATELKERRDSRCELEGNAAPDNLNTLLEIYGTSSRCFDFGTAWTERKCGTIRSFSQSMAGCYQFICSNGLLHLEIFNATTFYPCYHSGQSIHVKMIVDGWLREGIVICPPCEDFCFPESFPPDDAYGRCRPPTRAPNGYVGDRPLKEPCSGFRSEAPFLLLMALFVFSYSFFQMRLI